MALVTPPLLVAFYLSNKMRPLINQTHFWVQNALIVSLGFRNVQIFSFTLLGDAMRTNFKNVKNIKNLCIDTIIKNTNLLLGIVRVTSSTSCYYNGELDYEFSLAHLQQRFGPQVLFALYACYPKAISSTLLGQTYC